VDVQGEDGSWTPIDMVAIYSVVTNNFMRSGGDGYTILQTNAITPYDFGLVDFDVTRDYIASLGTITADTMKLEGRITMVNATLAPLE
jgi:5'-nucleotidase